METMPLFWKRCNSVSCGGISHHALHWVHIPLGEMEGKGKKKKNTKKKKKIKQEHGGKKIQERKRETIGCLCVTLLHMELMVV